MPIEPPSDPVKQIATRLVWEGLYDNNDHHFFGLNKSSVGLSSLHPTPAEAFRLWQIYLDYVNPLLKITHTPTLQPRIVEAVGDFTNLEPPLEALLFGIYCMAIQALSTEESMSIFKSSRGELLSRFQLGCQHALVNCGYLRTTDRDSLTAHLLYLVRHRIKPPGRFLPTYMKFQLSIGMAADPRAMSATLGLAVRTAQRMGLHSETALAKHPPFEVEMRRRLWWVLALYDTRIGELADYKNTGLSPTWDCKPPLNVNDSELWPDMKELPAVPADDHHRQSKPSEALFAVVRASMMDMVRRTSSYIGFYFSADPAFGGLANKLELSELQAMIEDRLLKGCDPENPEHCMATWMSRTGFARFHLMEHYARQGRSSLNPIEAQRDASISYALSYLENDTKMSGNMQLRRYDWYHRLHFPLPGYIHILYDLRMRPLGAHADRAWEVLGDNFDARSHVQDVPGKLRIRPLENLVFMAWEARIASLTRSSGGGSTESNPSLMPPRIVSYIQAARSSSSSSSLQGRGEQGSVAQNFDTSAGGGNSAGSDELDWGINTLPGMPFADSFPYGMDWQADFAAGLDVPGDTNVTQLNWATMGWGIGEN